MPSIALPTLTREIDSALACALPVAAPLRFLHLDDPASFITALQEGTPAGYIAGVRLDPELHSLLKETLQAVPDAHLVLGLQDDTGRQHIESNRLVRVSPLPSAARLCHGSRWVWFEGRVAELHRAVKAPSHPPAIRCALRTVLALRASSRRREPGERLPPRTLRALSRQCGVDRSTLRRAEKQSGVELRPFLFGWITALALRERFIAGGTEGLVPWLSVAGACGYDSPSGLRDLFLRTTGKSGVRQMEFPDLHEALNRLEAIIEPGS